MPKHGVTQTTCFFKKKKTLFLTYPITPDALKLHNDLAITAYINLMVFDWPHTTAAKACKICWKTTNHVAAQHRHPSHLIGQASPHQSQSVHLQRHRQKETVWEAFYPPPELHMSCSEVVRQWSINSCTHSRRHDKLFLRKLSKPLHRQSNFFSRVQLQKSTVSSFPKI